MASRLAPSRSTKLLHQPAKMLAALLEVAIGVEARTGGSQEDDLGSFGSLGGRRHSPGEVLAAHVVDTRLPSRREVALELLRGGTDQVAANAALGNRLGELGEPAALE